MTGQQFGVLAFVILSLGLLGMTLWTGEAPWGDRAEYPKLYWTAVAFQTGMIVTILVFAFVLKARA